MSNPMSRRFQFSLRDLLGLLLLAALIVWATTLAGIAYAGLAFLLTFFLASPMIVGALLRKPLEGCLASAFLVVVVFMGGFVVGSLLAD